MKVTIPFEFELKQLSHQRSRGHFLRFAVENTIEVDVREVDPADAPVAVEVDLAVAGAAHSHPLFRKSDTASTREVRWVSGNFYVDQGPVSALENVHLGWSEPHVGPFRRTRLLQGGTERMRRHVSAFDPAKTKSKVAEAVAVIHEAVERVIVVGGRVMEQCPEPVRVVTRKGVVGLGFAPATPGVELPVGGQNLQSTWDDKFAHLIDHDGGAPAGVTVLMPEVLGGDLAVGVEMRALRDTLGELIRCAQQMPLPNLVATRRLREAVAGVSVHPDERVIEAVEAFLAAGRNDRQFDAMRQAHDYAYRRHPHTREDLVDIARRTIAQSMNRLAEIVPAMRDHVGRRLYQAERADLVVLPESQAGLRRAHTKGEVMRAAVIAGVDPVALFDGASAGLIDVVLIEEGLPRMRFKDGQEFNSGFTRSTIVGVRITEPGHPPSYHFAPIAHPEVQAEALHAAYPALERNHGMECAP